MSSLLNSLRVRLSKVKAPTPRVSSMAIEDSPVSEVLRSKMGRPHCRRVRCDAWGQRSSHQRERFQCALGHIRADWHQTFWAESLDERGRHYTQRTTGCFPAISMKPHSSMAGLHFGGVRAGHVLQQPQGLPTGGQGAASQTHDPAPAAQERTFGFATTHRTAAALQRRFEQRSLNTQGIPAKPIGGQKSDFCPPIGVCYAKSCTNLNAADRPVVAAPSVGTDLRSPPPPHQIQPFAQANRRKEYGPIQDIQTRT